MMLPLMALVIQELWCPTALAIIVIGLLKSGDTCITEISCASIIAKVLRDREMTELHDSFHLRLYSQQRIWDKKAFACVTGEWSKRSPQIIV